MEVILSTNNSFVRKSVVFNGFLQRMVVVVCEDARLWINVTAGKRSFTGVKGQLI